MRPNIDFSECLKDSPRFRASLDDAEADIELLESKLERLHKLCNGMIETGKTYNNANSMFISGLKDLSQYFHQDELVSHSLDKFVHALSEMHKYHQILLDQAHRSICKNINNFIKNDIKKVKETRKHFEKISDDMDNAHTKNSQAPKSKPQECEDANNVLMAMNSAFSHTSLDYVFHINILHSKKRFEVLDTMLAFMHAQNTFFHQGHDLFGDLEPYMKDIANQLEELSAKAAVERKSMEDRHTLVHKKDLTVSTLPQGGSTGPGGSDAAEIKMEGYLFKRTSNAFKSWVRRWFMIQNNQLVYCKRAKDNLTIMEDDLRLCTVKPALEIDRRFCFEVVSPNSRHMLQGESDAECQAWMDAIQAGVSRAYRDHRSESEIQYEENNEVPETTEVQRNVSDPAASKQTKTTPKPGSRMSQLLAIPGNDKCCDCGSPEPRWASINLGITLCIECSGIHRSFGVHMSKVRSVTLDAWEPELLKVMAELGNDIVNRIYEANIDESVATRASSQCNRSIREAWIRAKYVEKAFVKKLPVPGEAGVDLDDSQKKWSVCRRLRRSPSRTRKLGEVNETPAPAPSAADSLLESPESPLELPPESLESPESPRANPETKMVQGESKDSGLGGSTQDVIVFGSIVNTESSINRNLVVLEDSEESASEPDDQDSKSITSLEDFSNLHPDMLLYKAAYARNLPVMLEALAQGANANWVNEDDDGKMPIMRAVESGSMAACEFLMLNGSKLDKKDHRGKTPLHHATMMGHTGQVCQFLKRGANMHAVDLQGMDPLAIAINNANADIVTLIRLAKLNEEMKETEGIYGAPGDETFNEVFRDFTNMASNNPEKLNRNK